MTMHRVSDLLGSMRALAHIRPPKGSYADWHRFLEQCRAAGVGAILAPRGGKDDGKFHGFATPLGYALLQRWRWLRDCERGGVPFEESEQLFRAKFERDQDAIASAERERTEALKRAEAEADEFFKYAGELNL